MMYDPLRYPYASHRNMVYGRRGMVASSHPLATEAGMHILRSGGNAIDAALAVAAAIAVVDPANNGPGGDCFALVWSKGKLHGLNSSGYSPKLLDRKAIFDAGYDKIPERGWLPVTVPGAPAGWVELSKKFGKLPLTEVFQPAVELAEGHPLSPHAGAGLKSHAEFFNKSSDPLYAPWKETYLPGNKLTKIGEMFSLKDLGNTLDLIAKTEGKAFYNGEIAQKIDKYSKETGGFLRGEDLADYSPQWVDPISVNYKGYDVWEIPPNGQGMTALMALNILKGFEFFGHDTVDTIHKQLEAMKLAFADAKRYIADPRFMDTTIAALLNEEYAAIRRGLINDTAQDPFPGKPDKGGTVYFCTADGEGNMVSMIQSLYQGWGSGVLVPGTGVALQDRGANFQMDETHPNCVAPRKKPYHTIIPGFLTKDGNAVGPFGVMGGFMQPQGHVQVIMNTVDFHMNPQTALDAPRWCWTEGKKVMMEGKWGTEIMDELRARGHEIEDTGEALNYGRGQIIWRNDDGVLCGGTEPRADGTVSTF